MPATQTYLERKAHGLCPQCQRPTSSAHVYCEACRKGMQAYHLEHRRAQGLAPHIAGPALLCCGTWHLVTQIPLRVACCGTLYLAQGSERMPETPPPSLTQRQAVPGARIVHLRRGWTGTIVRPEWPALWVDFDRDRDKGRKDARHVWGGSFGVLAEETQSG